MIALPGVFWILLYSWQALQGIRSKETPELVDTNYGKIKGFLDVSTKGKHFVAFNGVPYAKPPVMNLRFQDPQKPEPWSGIYEAIQQPPHCAQLDFASVLIEGKVKYKGEEDCLYLNVFVPKDVSDQEELPVMVFFHGGSYLTGGAAEYEAHEFLNENVILVVAQYRLGILGFLSTGDSILKGNFGLKDQTMALLWINENIAYFGGDPGRVTIFGQSAGGGSVHFHVLSEDSSNLFSRAILESGNLLCPWAKTREVRKDAMVIGEHFNCFQNGSLNSKGEEGSKNLLNCLLEVSIEELAVSVELYNEFTFIPLLAAPRVDGISLRESPEILLRNNNHKKLDLMFGVTRDEGAFMSCVLLTFEDQKRAIVEEFSRVGPVSLGLHKEKNGVEMSQQAYDYFVGGVKNDNDSIEALTKMYGDVNFGICSDWAALFHSKNNKGTQHQVYYYELHHRGQRSFSDHWHLPIADGWINHSDEVYYLFPFNETKDFQRNEEDSKIRDLLINLWVNFAKNGNPTPDDSLGFKWEAFTPESPKHLRVQLPPVMENDRREEVRNFWKALPTTQNKLLFGERKEEF